MPGGGRGQGRRQGLPRIPKELFGVMDMLTLFIVVMVLWVYTYISTYKTVHMKYVQFIVCQYCNAVKKEKMILSQKVKFLIF